ncbi:MAG: hypothetical protein KDE47_28435 [Caldilineaceae bacterium]|nr:hypothetical protein [Caldilineaceae bacterium]
MGTQPFRLNKLKVALTQVEALFEDTHLFLAVTRYAITHGVLEVVVHEGNFVNGQKILCGGCDYLSGALQGGPYKLKLSYHFRTDDDYPDFLIIGNEQELVIKCNRISSPTPWKSESKDRNANMSADVRARLDQLSQQLNGGSVYEQETA